MSSHFRPSVPADAEAISRLMQKAFGTGADQPGLSAEQMHWKYWRASADWEGSRGFVMEREGAVVAHGSVVPLSCAWTGQHLRLVHLIDWAAQQDCTGAGIALMKLVGNMVDGVFAAGGSDATQKILPALGFREIGIATRFILPIRLRARISTNLFRSWRAGARLGRNLFLTAHRRSSMAPTGWRARLLPFENMHGSTFPTPKSNGQIAVFERTTAAIADLLQCPAVPSELYVVEREGAVRGYFVLTLAGRQGRIAEAWIDSDQVDDWYALFTVAIQQAKAHREMSELVAVASTATELEALRRAGFPHWGQISLRAWIRNGKAPKGIRYQMVDGDAAYLFDGF
jgi:hypothetical protein